MKRLLVVGTLSLVVLVAGGAAADTFAVNLVSQTNSTVTLGWDPQPGYGYLFSADGNLVSRTNDASRSTVKFSKSFSAYEVAVIVKGATGTYPNVPPPPPPPPPAAQCADGIDNDQDGKVDYPADPGCLSATDNDESDPVVGGSVFLSANGNDANACTQAAPCRSMQRGFTVAQSEQTVVMAAGAYPQQTLANAQKTVTFQASGTVTLAGQLEIRCTTGITVDGVSAKNLLVAAGNRTLVVKNSQFGGGTYTAGVEDDPVVIGNVGSCSGGSVSDGVILDNVRVHDYFWQQNTGSAHTDCLQFFGGSNNVTIRNSVFERCAESFIGAFPDFGDIRNTIVEDTVFRDLWTNTGKGTFFAMQWGCPGHSGTGTGVTFRRTTWSPGVTVPIRTDCANFLVENNTFQTGPSQFACDDWDSRWGGTVVWRNNTFLNGDSCTT